MVGHYISPRYIYMTGNKNIWKVPSVDLTLHSLWIILRKMSECLRLSFLLTNSFAISAKLMLCRIFLWTFVNISACSQLFPNADLMHVLLRFKGEKRLALSVFVACECGSNLQSFLLRNVYFVTYLVIF